ncbi:glutathione S-transferase P 1-like isoform X2 [Pleurodeles waltl]|uniref:glutathione S-transferase P 1-like isoform X1 n=1 Tax=Pleurodeles waltl TaxID=8319 RepID=UPI00370983EE
MTQYTITYFNIHGRSGAMRYLLADQGCEWKEDKFSFQDWNDGKVELKKTAIFGQLPMFADGDFILFQSNAILRYLGRKHDLYGKNNKEAALIDMANDGVEDLREKIYKCLTQEWKTNKEKYLEELPNHLRNFERLLSQSSSGFIIGSTVSFADYNLLDILLFHLFIAPDCLNSFPRLKAFKEKMESRPKLKAFLQSNEHKTRPFLPENML